jgi:hypothetical protein
MNYAPLVKISASSRKARTRPPDRGHLRSFRSRQRNVSEGQPSQKPIPQAPNAQRYRPAKGKHRLEDSSAHGRRIVPFVIMRHGAGAARFHRQAGWVRSSAWIWLFSSTERTTA